MVKEFGEVALRTVHVNGAPFQVPRDELRDPHPDLGSGDCPWFDDQTDAVCTINGPHATTHIAHDGYGDVIAIWDEDHGYCPEDPGWRTR